MLAEINLLRLEALARNEAHQAIHHPQFVPVTMPPAEVPVLRDAPKGSRSLES